MAFGCLFHILRGGWHVTDIKTLRMRKKERKKKVHKFKFWVMIGGFVFIRLWGRIGLFATYDTSSVNVLKMIYTVLTPRCAHFGWCILFNIVVYAISFSRLVR